MKNIGNNLVLGRLVGDDKPFVLPAAARGRHLYVCGSTGTGKSKLLESMIRGDIVQWSRSKCGMLVLDPHGSLYDNLIEWLADSRNQLDRPIIPIDLRNDEWAVSYNPVRQRPHMNPSVITDALVAALVHTWGQATTDATPLFARNISMILRTLLDGNFTLADATHLLDAADKQVRHAMISKLHDPVASRHWREVEMLSTKDFIDRMSSTVNRLERFVGHELFRTILGQPGASLDLSKAMEDGAIILVSLATEGGKVSEENARTFGTLLLTDLWTSAKMRRKADNPKPFYVYIDEFQDFLTPTIARSLDQSRGFGVFLTLAQQFPRQNIHGGEHGEQIYDSIMENASSKIVFRLQNIDNLTPLAHSLFMGVMDTDEVKHQIFSTKVINYQEEERDERTMSRTRGSGGARHEASTNSDSEGTSETVDDDLNQISSVAAWNKCFSQASGNSESWMDSETESVAHRNVLVPILGKELSSQQYRSIDEQLFRAMQRLFRQRDRHFAVRVVGQDAPLFAMTPEVKRGFARTAQIDRYLKRQCRRWKFFLPMTDATQRIATRAIELPRQLLMEEIEEAPTARRKLPDRKRLP
jgi:hypothetical protein